MEYRTHAFETELDDIKQVLLVKKHVAIVGVSGGGSRSLIHLLEKELKHVFTKVILIEFTKDISLLSSSIAGNSKTVLLIPNYSSKSDRFKTEFQEFLNSSKGKNIYSIIDLDINYYLNVKQYFKISLKPVSEIYFLSARNKVQTKELVTEKFNEHSLQVNNSVLHQIYTFSGGIPCLIKRCAEYFVFNNHLSLESVLKELKVKLNLEDISVEFDTLRAEEKQRLGLIDSDGIILSSLFSEYRNMNMHTVSTSLLESVTKFFTEKREHLVTFDDIDFLLEKHGDFSVWKRYKIIERVKKALKTSYTITNVRGTGYKVTRK